MVEHQLVSGYKSDKIYLYYIQIFYTAGTSGTTGTAGTANTRSTSHTTSSYVLSCTSTISIVPYQRHKIFVYSIVFINIFLIFYDFYPEQTLK